ncbi:MAG: CCA tRNA nucleotidyltransferase [Terriglobia bacterium]
MKRTAIEIVRKLRQAGFQAYWVGGCVRDLVMGHSPTDYDIATSATPEELFHLFPRGLAVGAQFGVVIIPEEGNLYEVATFRSEEKYTDGRHPDRVRYTLDPREDVQRRDFTINGLLYDPLEEEVIDYVGGQSDIHSRIIRTIGDPWRRFEEDRLRLIRAVRFAARFDYQIETNTWQALSELAPNIEQVSPERIRDELIKILTQGYAARGMTLLDSCGLLRIILPEITHLHGVEQPPEFHPEGDVWIHTILMLGLMDQRTLEGRREPSSDSLEESGPNPPSSLSSYPSPTLALGVLLHDIGKPETFERSDRIRFNNHPEVGSRMAVGICERLRFPTRQVARISELVRDHLRFKDVPQMKLSTLKRFLRRDGFAEHLELHRLDCLSSHRNLATWQFLTEKMNEMGPEETRPKPLLSGNDLIRLGFLPGPRFKEILKSVEDAQLDNVVSSEEEATKFVLEHFSR